MLTVAFFSFVLAFVFEGLSHGIRTRECYSDASTNKKSLNTQWHFFNVVFIVLLIFGVFSYIWSYFYEVPLNQLQLPRDFLIEAGFTITHVALMRFCIFNYSYNFGAKKSIFYIGETSKFDIFYSKYIMKFYPPVFVFLTKVFILTGVFFFM
jgi:hypothetical protein